MGGGIQGGEAEVAGINDPLCPTKMEIHLVVEITIRGVPESFRDEIVVRAARRRQSMQEFLQGELELHFNSNQLL